MRSTTTQWPETIYGLDTETKPSFKAIGTKYIEYNTGKVWVAISVDLETGATVWAEDLTMIYALNAVLG